MCIELKLLEKLGFAMILLKQFISLEFFFLKDPIPNINGIFQKFENSRLFKKIRFVIISFKFADWLKMAGISKLFLCLFVTEVTCPSLDRLREEARSIPIASRPQ